MQVVARLSANVRRARLVMALGAILALVIARHASLASDVPPTARGSLNHALANSVASLRAVNAILTIVRRVGLRMASRLAVRGNSPMARVVMVLSVHAASIVAKTGGGVTIEAVVGFVVPLAANPVLVGPTRIAAHARLTAAVAVISIESVMTTGVIVKARMNVARGCFPRQRSLACRRASRNLALAADNARFVRAWGHARLVAVVKGAPSVHGVTTVRARVAVRPGSLAAAVADLGRSPSANSAAVNLRGARNQRAALSRSFSSTGASPV